MKKTISHLLAILFGLILISATCSPEATTVYSISASPLSSFGTLTIPYSQPTARTVTITNDGMGAIKLDPLPSPPTGYSFPNALSPLDLAPGGTATFSIRPNAGLGAGTYNTSFKVTGSNGVSVTISPSFTVNASSAIFSGSGTIGSPYLINNATDLNKLSELINLGNMTYAAAGVCYRLNSSFTMPTGIFTPIGTVAHPFQGTFDGNNKIITNLTVNTPNDFSGLFGYVRGGKISNLGLADVIINGGKYVGGVAGVIASTDMLNRGSVAGCYVTGQVSGWSNSVGGITGIVGVYSTVSNCYTTCSINGTSFVGGIAGEALDYSIVALCYATGAIGGGEYVGGIVGDAEGEITNNVALNPTIIQTGGSGTNFWRICRPDWATLSGNVAYIGMLVKGFPVLDGTGNGLGVGKTTISLAAAWTARGFVSPSPWTVQNGRLPGLFGNTVEIPSHITVILP